MYIIAYPYLDLNLDILKFIVNTLAKSIALPRKFVLCRAEFVHNIMGYYFQSILVNNHSH